MKRRIESDLAREDAWIVGSEKIRHMHGFGHGIDPILHRHNGRVVRARSVLHQVSD